jgi:hypothetical protein
MRIMAMHIARHVSVVLLFIFWSGVNIALGQDQSQVGKQACLFPNPPELNDKEWDLTSIDAQFATVRDLRARLADLIPDQKKTWDDARTALANKKKEQADLQNTVEQTDLQVNQNKSALAQIDSQIEELKKDLAAKPDDEDKKKQLYIFTQTKQTVQSQLDDATTKQKKASARVTALPDEIQKAQTADDKGGQCYQYLQSLSNRVEQKIVGLLIPASQKGTFKLYLSLIYAAIVLVLIGGFYALAFIDAPMRNAIFGQQAGIQFITLFSLVIAIILFGVLDVLQDKELAALLGGISGYILGRVSTDRVGVSTAGRQSKSLAASTIGFTAPDTIVDSASRLGLFAGGENLEISGSQNNDGFITVKTAAPGSITTQQQTIKSESAGPVIRITALS